jgi:hypothetical protein
MGLISAHSIVNNGFILLVFWAIATKKCIEYQIILLWTLLVYIVVYVVSLTVTVNLWNSFRPRSWSNNSQKRPSTFSPTPFQNVFFIKCIIDYLRFTYKLLYPNCGFDPFVQHFHVYNKVLCKKLVPSLPFRPQPSNETLAHIKKSKSYFRNFKDSCSINQGLFLGSHLYKLRTHFKDYFLYITIWILFGLPPFFPFLLKFFIIVYLILSGLVFPSLFYLLVSSSLIICGLVRALTLSTVVLKYQVIAQ